ncbi:hypothetical protein [Kitasatospora sp. LaBMicrA B282]|uniref:hypothetical protein n=1 Tax=Kitasatospora sp. LaBMicrA B282 TaxID=3420949 RepID=UPI003D126FB0
MQHAVAGNTDALTATIETLRQLTSSGDYAFYVDIAHFMADLPLEHPTTTRWLDTEDTVRTRWHRLVLDRRTTARRTEPPDDHAAPHQWGLLTSLAETPGAWVAEGPADEGRRRRATTVRELAAEGLCELADDQILQNLRDDHGHRPGWAARILPAGLLVLRYHQLHTAAVTGEPPAAPPVPAGIELTRSELEALRRVATLAPLLPGARAQALADALAQAVPGPTGKHWTIPASVDAIEAAFRLEMPTGAINSRSYHRVRREHRTGHAPLIRLTHDSPDI